MTRTLPAFALLALLGAAAPALAQSTPDVGKPVETDTPVQLPPEKQELIKQHVARQNIPSAETGGPVTVGMPVPQGVALRALPQDQVTELPQVTAYNFFVTGGLIAIVDPVKRTVVQVIAR